jgi:hypothetical protein
MLNKVEDLRSLGTGMYRLEFTNEDYEYTKQVIKAHKKVLQNGETTDFVPNEETTKGHFYRGV